MPFGWEYKDKSGEYSLDIINGEVSFTMTKDELCLTFSASTNPSAKDHNYREMAVYKRKTGNIKTEIEYESGIKKGIILPILSENYREILDAKGLPKKIKGLVSLILEAIRE